MWCHVRHLNLIDKNLQRITKKDKELISKLNYEVINFPVPKKDFYKIEVQNKICINVFFENKVVYPVHLSNQKFNDSKGLLFISDKFKSHYVYIKDFDRFMLNKIKYKGKKYICKNCLHFWKKEITTKSLTQPCLLKVYVSLLSQEHFQNYCKLCNC